MNTDVENKSNAQFKVFTRSSAFKLDLHMTGINALCWMHHCNEMRKLEGKDPYNRHTVESRSTGNYLARRGLIQLEYADGEDGMYSVTSAGTLTAQLLEIAGFGYQPGDLFRWRV